MGKKLDQRKKSYIQQNYKLLSVEEIAKNLKVHARLVEKHIRLLQNKTTSSKKKKIVGAAVVSEGANQKKRFDYSSISTQTKYIAGALVAIVLVAMVLRFIGFSQQHNLTFDEALYTRMGHQIMDGQPYNSRAVYKEATKQGRKLPDYLKQPLFKHPPLYCFSISIFHSLFGPGYSTAVKVSVLFGIATIVLVFFIGKLLKDWKVGLLSAALLAIEPVHWICSQKIWMDTTLTFFMTATVFCFLKSLKEEKYFKYAGIAFGCAILTKYPGVLVGIGVFLYALLSERTLFRNKRFWLVPGIAFLMFLPWLIKNISVYGFSFFTLKAADLLKLKNKIEFSLFFFIGLFILIMFILLLFYMRKKQRITLIIKERLRIEEFYRIQLKYKSQLFIGISVALLLFLFTFSGGFRSYLYQLSSLSFIPKNGWTIGMFNNEPWYFYIKRLSILSPLYLFGFVGIIFNCFRNKKFFYLFVNSVVIFIFFTIWAGFQCRYILPLVPLLIIFVSFSILDIYERIFKFKNKINRNISLVVFFITLFYFVIKTLQIDFTLALPNTACYF